MRRRRDWAKDGKITASASPDEMDDGAFFLPFPPWNYALKVLPDYVRGLL